MSTPIDPEILALYREALELPDSRTKVELLEQAVRIADHQGHIEAGWWKQRYSAAIPVKQ